MAKKRKIRASAAPVASSDAKEDGAAQAQAACPVVGVGASAGGLEAFTQLLTALPVDTGMAFVLVQHLAPTQASALAEILSRATRMSVAEVSEDCPIVPNHVYVMPPGQTLSIAGGKLHLLKREAHTQHHPVDLFFQALATDLGHRAIGVVLSGTATDGTVGLEEIKAAGGLTFAQDDTAQHDGMPRSAVSSGCVDLVLPPAGIAEEIARIAKHPFVATSAKLPSAGAADARVAPGPEGVSKDALGSVLRALGEATRVDFDQYKETTLRRRITRRMVLLKLADIEEYARHLDTHPGELELLFGDILINVTSFFRDPATFRALGTLAIPKLLEGRSRHDPLRIWVPGCSTGEEAYTLAMLIAEVTEASGKRPPVQLFATDLNVACIQKARAALYSKHAIRNLSQDRLRRFFVQANGNYQVAKSIRDSCVFAVHNLLSDPPFSSMDLVSCRNLLIYLEPAAQKRVIALLHYALRPEGFLLLGSSETVGAGELFEVADAKHKIYRRRAGSVRLLPQLAISRGKVGGREAALGGKSPGQALPRAAGLMKTAERLLLDRFVPPGVLVDTDFEILQFSGDTVPYLAPRSGKASLNVLKMAREGLAIPLRSALLQAAKTRTVIRAEGLSIKASGRDIMLDLAVIPIQGEPPAAAAGGFLVLFEARGPSAQPLPAVKRGKPSKKQDTALEQVIERLERELATTREHLRSLVEHEQAAYEELQSANEESQSANEELQSINEELQTSKEEIQSSNEELTTVNDELHTRNLETGRLNDDLTNLILSLDMAVVIVGRDLCIRRFSPAAGRLLNVIASDLGRPISDIRMKIDLPDISELLSECIDAVSSREREVQGENGAWYSLRVRPYVTLDNKIDGAVVILVDVDKIRRAREYAESLVATIRQPLLVLDGDLRVQTANRSFFETFGVGPEETEGHLAS